MVYYLRPASSYSLDASPSSPSFNEVMKKYGPSFLHAIYAFAITFVLCHLLSRMSPNTFSFLCKKDSKGVVMIDKDGNAQIDESKGLMVSGIVSGVALVVSLGMVYKYSQ
jgi:hypothetical protein